MVEKLKQFLNTLLEKWKNLSAKQKGFIISSVAVVVIAIIILAVVLTRPNYQILKACEDYKEMNSIASILADKNIAYEIDDNRMTVKVKKSDLINAKMIIAEEDIQSAGYTFEDAMKSSFTTTEEDKNKQYAHYLENKFADDLEAMDGIKGATVSVTLADTNNSFFASTAETSVAVTLDTNKSFSTDAAESIANFLATAVGNKSTNSITIINRDGNTLFSGPSNASSNSGVSYANQQKFKGQIEDTTKNSLKQTLLATGMYDDMYISLNYVLDWDAVNTIAKEYSTQGDEQAIFKESYEEASEGTNGAGGTPGTGSNNDDTTYTITDGAGSTTSYYVNQYTYLPNELVTTTVKEPGSIIYDSSSLAVTFIKTMVYHEEECEALGYLNDVTWEEFKAQNTEPVALQVDQNWIALLAAGTGVAEDRIQVLAYQRPFFEDSPASNIMENVSFWIQIVLAIAILGLLIFIVIRSARPLTVEEREPELSVEEMLATTKEQQPRVDDIDIHEKSDTRLAIEKFVDENPEAVALLLRNWLNEGWD